MAQPPRRAKPNARSRRSIPPAATSLVGLVGREVAVRELVTRLRAGERVVTLTGPAGIGKSRLALAVASTVASEFDAGTVRCGLAEGVGAESLLQTVARESGLPRPRHSEGDAGNAELATGLDALGPLLLVLDDADAVLSEVAALVEACLAAGSACSFVVTSREAMAIAAERVVLVERLSADESLTLFESHAAGARWPEADVAAWLDWIEGNPLAIELSAQRARAISPRELLERGDGAFDRIRSTRRDTPERHRSLAAAVAPSFDRLTPNERRAFLGLALFEGPVPLEAFEAVVGPSLEGDPIDVAQALLGKSLVSSLAGAGAVRLGMPRALRSFALAPARDRRRGRIRERLSRAPRGVLPAARRGALAAELRRRGHRRARCAVGGHAELARGVRAVAHRGSGARRADRDRAGRRGHRSRLGRPARPRVLSGLRGRGRIGRRVAADGNAPGAGTGAPRDGATCRRRRDVARCRRDGRPRGPGGCRCGRPQEPCLGGARPRALRICRETPRKGARALRRTPQRSRPGRRAGGEGPRALPARRRGRRRARHRERARAPRRQRQSTPARQGRRGIAAVVGLVVESDADPSAAVDRAAERTRLRASAAGHHAAGRLWREAIDLFRLAAIEDSDDVRREDRARAQAAATAGGIGAAVTTALATASRETAERAAPSAGWKVGEGARWVQAPGGPRVDLSRHGSVRLALDALVVRRLAEPGVATPATALLEQAWPGERVRHESGMLRVYTAVRRLRAMGLADVLETRDDGYLLSARVTFERHET